VGEKVAHHSSYYDLCDALSEPGCPICRLNAATAERYLDGLLWEMVNDPGVREKIRQAQGFCNTHAWGLARIHCAALGVAIIHRDVLGALLEELASVSGNHAGGQPALADTLLRKRVTAGSAAARRLRPRHDCPACVHVQAAESRYLEAFVELVTRDDEMRARYLASDGLCQPHFRQALRQAADEKAVSALVSAQREIWERLAAHLSEFVRKSDYRFCDEPMGEERDAWLRSIGALSGADACRRQVEPARRRPAAPAESDAA
jgi:hypothetical protein